MKKEDVNVLLKKSWNAFANNKLKVALCVVLDFLFVLTLIINHGITFMLSKASINQLMATIQEKSQGLSPFEMINIDRVLMQDPAFVQAYNEMLKFIGLFFLISIALFIVFEGLSWFIIYRMSKAGMKFLTYAWRFAAATIVSFIIFIIALSLYVFLLKQSTFSPIPIFTPGLANAVLIFLVVFLDYLFVYWMSALFIKSVRSLIKIPFKRTLMPVIYAIALIAFVMVSAVFYKLLAFNKFLGIFFGIAILLPSMTYFRILFVKTVKKALQIQ